MSSEDYFRIGIKLSFVILCAITCNNSHLMNVPATGGKKCYPFCMYQIVGFLFSILKINSNRVPSFSVL